MPRPNLSAVLTPEQLDEIKKKISEIQDILKFCVNLTPKERKNNRKMGPKSVAYVDLALSVARNHPDLVPARFSVDDFEEDVLLSKSLQEVYVMLAPLDEMLDDTRKLVGMECIKMADTIYNILKIASKENEALEKIKEQLSERFKNIGMNRGKGKRKKKKPPQDA